MRHRGSFPQPLPIAALTFRVAQAAVLAALVPGSCGPQTPPARAPNTPYCSNAGPDHSLSTDRTNVGILDSTPPGAITLPDRTQLIRSRPSWAGDRLGGSLF